MISGPNGELRAEISKYSGSATEVSIPESIILDGESVPVASIGEQAFSHNEAITSVAIPDGVLSIGASAFEWCMSLGSVSFGENSCLESIGEKAFSNCSFASIVIPSGVLSIGNSAFGGNWSLASIFIEAGSQPDGWSDTWDRSLNQDAEVYWGGEWTMVDGVPTPK